MEELFQEFSAGLRALAPVVARLAAENLSVSTIVCNSITGKIDCVILNVPAPWMNCVTNRGVSKVSGQPWILVSGVFDGVLYECFVHSDDKDYEKFAAMAKGGKK